MSNYKKLLLSIKTLIFDVDGVMTDGIVILSPDGDMLRTMNVKDGYALQLAIKKGYQIIIISGGRSELVKHRFAALGIEHIYIGINNKLELFHKIVEELSLNKESILYMGDDIPDYKIMIEVGVAACPADAAEEIRKISQYISSHNGGKGCVRDVVEQVLKVQNNWFDEDGFHW
jgi:3-deoxy-D-manno-octulosonate 8-phosphate phosphatase (KDO 8-P phosphatase)